MESGHDSIEVFKSALTSLMNDLESLSVAVAASESSEGPICEAGLEEGEYGKVVATSWADDLPDENWEYSADG